MKDTNENKMDSIKLILKNLIKEGIFKYHSLKQYRYYKQLLHINNLPNNYVKGEKEWIKKWSVLDKKVNPIYYRLYSHYIGNDINIVPEDICHDIIEPILDPLRYTKYYSDKNIFDKLFPDGYLAKTLLRKMNGFYYDEAYRRIIIDETSLIDKINKANVSKLIIKPSVGGISGVGVRCFEKRNGAWYVYGGNDVLSLHYVEAEYGSDFIIQEFLEQHESINHFCSTSVNTLRLTLYRSVKDDECVVPSAIMRIGNQGSVVDNAHAGGRYVGIDVASGKLKNDIFDQYGRKYKTFNKIDFTTEQKIPYDLWIRTLQFAKSIGKYIPHHRLLALDIMIDKNGNPRLVEFNVEYYSMWFFQFTIGSAFGKYTDEIIDFCSKKRKSLEYIISIKNK